MSATTQPQTTRAHAAPAYYLGRPASWWLAAAARRRQAPAAGHRAS